MERLTDGLKKILLAGIGTVAVTAEKSKEVLDEMVKRGELTVEQGKVLNQELKHNIKDTVKKNVNVSVKPQSPEELEELLDKMTPEPPEMRFHNGKPCVIIGMEKSGAALPNVE